MSHGNNIVRGFADALCDLAAKQNTELDELRNVIIARDCGGDKSTYQTWAATAFATSGNNAEYAELLWLRAQTTSKNLHVPSHYPG